MIALYHSLIHKESMLGPKTAAFFFHHYHPTASISPITLSLGLAILVEAWLSNAQGAFQRVPGEILGIQPEHPTIVRQDMGE